MVCSMKVFWIIETYLYFNLMPLLCIFHFPVFVSKFCFLLLQLTLGYFPECVHLCGKKKSFF